MAGTLAHHGDIRMIVGAGTFTHASSAYKGNNSDESGVERLQEKSGGLMVSAHVPSVSQQQAKRAYPFGFGAGRGDSTDVGGRLDCGGRIHPCAHSGRSSYTPSCYRTSPSRARRSFPSGRRSTPKAMAETVQYVVPVELREADDGPMLRGVVLQEGRAAAQGGRAEVFAPLSVVWPSDGIALRGEHRGARAGPRRADQRR